MKFNVNVYSPNMHSNYTSLSKPDINGNKITFVDINSREIIIIKGDNDSAVINSVIEEDNNDVPF